MAHGDTLSRLRAGDTLSHLRAGDGMALGKSLLDWDAPEDDQQIALFHNLYDIAMAIPGEMPACCAPTSPRHPLAV